MKHTSKYWDMISKDSTIILFNSLYNSCYEVNSNIVRTYKEIYNNCNRGFSNLLSGNRVLKKLAESEYDYFLGFGKQGFGTTGSSYGNLYYASRTLGDYKKVIINNSNLFRNHVKKTPMYKEMFDITVNALTKIPSVYPIGFTLSVDIKSKSYTCTKEYEGIRTKSPFERYDTGFGIELIGSTKDTSYYNCPLTSEDVSQDTKLYHVYDDSSKLLKNHLDDLRILENEFKKYMKSKAYLKLKDELDIIAVTKTI